jgi:sigma-E factor negative regulatory protein RseA
MNEELDSQLSAMFDDELASSECELLARRLSRDDEMKARWSRYAAIGATIRAEGSARLSVELARRVSCVITNEPTLIVQPARSVPSRLAAGWRWPLTGFALAASVAAASIFWIMPKSQDTAAGLVATNQSVVEPLNDPGHGLATSATVDSYVVPKAREHRGIVPPTQLANYVVAHSEFSSPVNRRNLLSTLMSSESGTTAVPAGSEESTEDVYDDAKNSQ